MLMVYDGVLFTAWLCMRKCSKLLIDTTINFIIIKGFIPTKPFHSLSEDYNFARNKKQIIANLECVMYLI